MTDYLLAAAGRDLSSSVTQSIRAVAQSGARRCVEDLRRLIAMPTPNPPGDEAKVARYLGAGAELFGATVSYAEVKPGRPNMIAEWRFGGARAAGPTLLLTSHMDVVPAPEALYTAGIDGDRLYGRGACDAKGQLAAMLAACAAITDLAESGLPLAGRLVFAAVIDEESGGSGTEHLAAHGPGPFDAAIVGEPTGLAVVRGHRGSLRRRIVFHGAPAHSSDPSRGENAIYHAARFALAIEALHGRLQADHHPEYGAATASLNIISGGTKVNVIPDRCAVDVDRRLRPGETVAAAHAEIETILHELLAATPMLHWSYEPISGDKDPAVIDADHPLVALVARCAAAATGDEPRIDLFRAGTDMVYLLQSGVPTVVCGPGSLGVAHTDGEFVPLGELAAATEVYTHLACRFLRG